MAPKLYFMEMSPPATSVLLTAAAINLELELVYVNVLTKEHLSPEYLKVKNIIIINPTRSKENGTFHYVTLILFILYVSF